MAGSEPDADHLPPAPDDDASERVREPVWRRAARAITNHALAAVVGVIVLAVGGTVLVNVGLKDPPRRSPPELLASLRVFTHDHYRQALRSRDISQAENLVVAAGGRFALIARVLNRGEAPATNVEIFLRVGNGVTLNRAACRRSKRFRPCPTSLSLLQPSVRLRKLQRGFTTLIVGTLNADARAGVAIQTDLTADSDNAPRTTDNAWVTVAPQRQPAQ